VVIAALIGGPVAAITAFRVSVDSSLNIGLPSNASITPAPKLATDADFVGNQEWCGLLKAIVPLGAEEFRPILGDMLKGKRWTTKRELNGWAKCYIEEALDVTYICEDIDRPTQKEATDVMRQRKNEFLKCLGPEWTVADDAGYLHNFTDDMINFSVRTTPAPKLESMLNLNPAQTAPAEQYHVHFMLRRAFSLNSKSTNPKTPAAPSGFCQDLKRVLAFTRDDFRSIANHKKGLEHDARIQLPGFFNCRVEELEDFGKHKYYTCSGPPVKNGFLAGDMLETVSAEIKTCLGAKWRSRDRFGYNNGLVRMFENSEKDFDIELRERRSYDERHEIKLDVNMLRATR
jgi:hypothetical protein